MKTSTQKENCFTLLRYLFALGIFCNHLCDVTKSEHFLWNSSLYVQGFFIISGFLTFNSFKNYSNLKVFILKRIRRIIPAYVITILLGFAIGMMVTQLPISEFLNDSTSWKYLGANLVFLNNLQPTLPGVFESNHLPFINAALWTMKIEIAFYCTVPIVFYLIKKIGSNRTLINLIIFSLLYYVVTDVLYAFTQNSIYNILNHQLPGMLCFFYTPVLFLYNPEQTKKAENWLYITSFLLFICSFYLNGLQYLAPVYLSILFVFTAYRAEKYIHAFHWKDFTYEFYLLHFLVLQTLQHFQISESLLAILALSFVCTATLAVGLHYICSHIGKRIPIV